MKIPWQRREPRSILSGAVCTIHIVVNMDFKLEEQAWELLGSEGYQGRLKWEILAATHQSLGPEFGA